MPILSSIDLYTPTVGLPTAEKIVPRLVVADTGAVVYASEGFEQLVHASPYALEGTRLQDLIIFCDPDLALSDRPFAMVGNETAAEPSWCTAIDSGVHAIFLRDRGDQVFAFQFDWVRTSGGTQPHLIITMNESGEEEKPISPLMAQKLITAKQRPARPVAAKIQHNAPSVRAAFMDARPVDNGINDASAFFDMSDDMMVCAKLDGTLTRVNQAFLDTLGVTPVQIGALNFLDLIAETDRARVQATLAGLSQNDPGTLKITFEAQIAGVNGVTHYGEWRISRKGETVLILGRDMTAVRENEAQFIRHQQQLSEAESIAHMGYWRWTIGDPVMTWSDEIYRIFGVEKGVFIPTFDTVNAMLHRSDVGRMGQVFQRAMMEQNTYEMDFCLTRPTGETRSVRCEGRCETDGNDETIALFGIMQDITDRTRVENELRESKENAERAYASKSKFLANMSHELRTPLNAIIGFSEMMQRQLLGPIGTPKYLDYIDGIRQSGEHLLDLISDILDMSKIEAGKYKLELEEVNISKIMRLAIGMTEGRARESSVDLSAAAETSGDEIRIQADRRAVLQMMLNLLSNAIKFTNGGGSVRVTLSRDDQFVKFQVTDTGIGIPANMLHTIARPFEQAANQYTRAHEGSGLGLSITKELCMMHGGNLDIQSEVGKGTCVTITLPIADV